MELTGKSIYEDVVNIIYNNHTLDTTFKNWRVSFKRRKLSIQDDEESAVR